MVIFHSSPQLCVGFLFLILYPGCLLLPPPPASSLSHTTLSYTIFHTQLCHTLSFPYNFVTHYLSHTTLSHTIFPIQLCHALSFTYNFVTHYLSHTTLSHTIFHTQLCQQPSFPYNFVNHHLSHTTLSHTIFHTTLSHTIFHTQLCHTPSFTHNFVTHHLSHTLTSHTLTRIPSLTYNNFTRTNLTYTNFTHTHTHTQSHIHVARAFCVAGASLVALGGALGPGLVARDARGAAALCVAGVAFGDIHLDFTWQAWDNLTSMTPRHFCVAGVASTSISRGRRGTISHPRSFCVAGASLMALGRFSRAWRPWRRGTLRGRRGTWWHPPWFHVAGVGQSHIHGRFAWQAPHSWHWVAPLGPV